MKFVLGGILFSIFLLIAIFHIYWGFGGKWGALSAIPTKTNNEKVMNPGLLACITVASGLVGFGIFILIRAGFLSYDLPYWLTQYGLSIISVIFLLRAVGDSKYVGLFKKIKNTRFGEMDTKYFTPLCLLIGLMVLVLELIA